MGANVSTGYEANGSAMNRGLVITPTGSSVKNGQGNASNGFSASNVHVISYNGLSANKGRVIVFPSSKWKIHFEASKLNSTLMVIDFTAPWCGPGRYMEPFMNELAATYTDVDFIKIDVDELKDAAQEFGVNILPTFMLIKKGKEVDKLVGANKEELRKKIVKHRSI